MSLRKGIIFYYSGSGNTKLACNYIKNQLTDTCSIKLIDITRNFTFQELNVDEYDLFGFSTFTNFWDASKIFYDFLDKLAINVPKPAFILNTYGFTKGFVLNSIKKILERKNFRVIAGYSLHTPESYPPMIKSGKGYVNAPNSKELKKFNEFLLWLGNFCKKDQLMNEKYKRISKGLIFKFIAWIIRINLKTPHKDMGNKTIKEETCTQCGICANGCPYNAIKLDPYPIFDEKLCYGCWYCYNHCPTQSIQTRKFRGEFQYPKPTLILQSKFK